MCRPYTACGGNNETTAKLTQIGKTGKWSHCLQTSYLGECCVSVAGQRNLSRTGQVPGPLYRNQHQVGNLNYGECCTTLSRMEACAELAAGRWRANCVRTSLPIFGYLLQPRQGSSTACTALTGAHDVHRHVPPQPKHSKHGNRAT